MKEIMSSYFKIKDVVCVRACDLAWSSDNHTNNARVAAEVCHKSSKNGQISRKRGENRLKLAWSFSLTHKIFNVNERRKERNESHSALSRKYHTLKTVLTFFGLVWRHIYEPLFLFVPLCTVINANVRSILYSLWCLIFHSKEFHLMRL